MRRLRALGLMSGTSMDGIDVALIETDGDTLVRPLARTTIAYDDEFRRRLRHALRDARTAQHKLDRPGSLAAVERELTERHVAAVAKVRREAAFDGGIDVIGFHGQTVLHRPRPASGETRLTLQIGDGSALAEASGVKVVYDLRAADFAAGGEGAPLVPIYHRALAAKLAARPLAILNIGGVANITVIGSDGDLLACDTGPGNALIDDWVLRYTGAPYDDNGLIARSGTCDEQVLARLLANPYFDRPAPKSLDRDAFPVPATIGQSVADGAATLTEFTARAVERVLSILPERPNQWIVVGGGRRNGCLIESLRRKLGAPVAPSESVGIDGDATEAEAWAFLAVRSLYGLPITFRGTTGAPRALSGGVVALP